MFLPQWNSDLYIDIASWFPFGKDYKPVSVNSFYDERLKNIAESCLEFYSELFFMVSPLTGCVGTFTRDNAFRFSSSISLNLGFMIILGYSYLMEKIVCAALCNLDEKDELLAGIVNCSIQEHGIFTSSAKAIAIVGNEPFFDPDKFLSDFSDLLTKLRTVTTNESLAFFAEKFGYSRFSFNWELENPDLLKMKKVLSEFEFEGTRKIIGPSPEISFPPFLGAVISGL